VEKKKKPFFFHVWFTLRSSAASSWKIPKVVLPLRVYHPKRR
jgi:hypothetical protein